MTEINSDPVTLETSIKENLFTRTRLISQFQRELNQIENKFIGDYKLNINENGFNDTSMTPSSPSEKEPRSSTHKNLNLKLKDSKFFLKEIGTPGSLNSNDIQNKIMNEMLNSQSENRNLGTTKIQNRINENKKQLNFTKTNESAFDINTTKLGIEDSEEVRGLQDKINELQMQIQTKSDILEARKVRLESEMTSIKSSEEQMHQDYYILKRTLEEIQTKRSTLRNKMSIDSAKEKLKKIRKESVSYKNEITKLEESIQKRESEINHHERIIENEFDSQIRQLDETLRMIQQEKIIIHAKLNETFALYSQNLEQKAMMKEDLNAKLLQRAELVAQREELDEIFEGLKASNKNEISYYAEEAQLKEDLLKVSRFLNELSIEKKRILPQFEATLEDIKVLNNKLFDLEKAHQVAIAEKNEKMASNNTEIESIENFINSKSRELGILELDKMFDQICSNYSSHIEKEILSKQLMLIEDEEKKITEKYEHKEANIMEGITILRNKPEDPIINAELQDLHNKLEQLKIRHELRKEAIQKWKDDVRDVLTEKSEREATQESEGYGQDKLIEKVFAMMKEKKISEEEQNRFHEHLNRYIKTIEQHEIYTHQKLQEEINIQEEKKLIEDQIERRKQEKVVLDEKMRKIEEEYNRTLLQKKNLEQELNEKKAIIQHQLLKEADAAFNAYLSQQSSTFDAITRTYGVKAAQNIKTEHHKEFIEITKGNQLKRIERFKQVQNELKYLDQVVNHNVYIVDQEILPTLKNIVNYISEEKNMNAVLKKQHISLLEAEDEISNKLSIIVNNRNAKLNNSKENYALPASQALMKMKETKKLLEKKYALMEEETTKLENHIIECDKVITQMNIDEGKIMKDIQGIEGQLSQVRPTSNEIEPLEKEIRVMKKHVEELEMQKIVSEQRFIEQNFLNDDYHIPNSYDTHDQKGSNESFHDDINRILNFKNEDKENNNDRSRVLEVYEKYSPMNPIELSPIKNVARTPDNMKAKRKLFDNHLRESLDSKSSDTSKHQQQQQLPPTSTSTSKNYKLLGKKTPNRESKENISYLKNYQQKTNHNLTQANITPQSYQNINLNTITNQNRATSVPKNRTLDLTKLEKKYIDQPSVSEASNETRKVHLRFDSIDSQSYMNLPLQANSRHSPKNVTININNITNTTNSGNSSLNNTITQYHNLLNQMTTTTPPNVIIQSNSTNPTNKIISNFPLKTIDEDQTSYRAAYKTNPNNPIQLTTIVDKSAEYYNANAFKYLQNNPPVGNMNRKSVNNQVNKTLSLDTSMQLDHVNNSLIMDRKSETLGGRDGSDALNFFRNYTVLEDQKPLKVRLDEYLNNSRASNSRSTSTHQHRESRRPRSMESHARSRQQTLLTEESDGGNYKALNNSSNSLHGNSVDAVRNKHRRDSSVGARQKSIFKFKLENCTLQDIAFFESIKPLLEGGFLFKKFTSYQSLKKNAFDPLVADIQPPENCGFGMRHIKLAKNLEKIEIRHALKPGIEMVIPASSIMRPIVPQITMDILRVQKRTFDNLALATVPGDTKGVHVDINQKTIFAQKGQALAMKIEKCMHCSHYPFSVLLEKGGRIELIAPNYPTFREWINGLNCIMKNKKNLSKMKTKIETYSI